MENRVGGNVPKAADLAAIQKKLEDALVDLRKFCVTLSQEERTSRVHPRKGFDQVVPVISDLAGRHGVKLADSPLEDLVADNALLQSLQPLSTVADTIAQLLSDTMMQAGHEAAQTALLHYAVLSSMAAHNPELAAALRPVREVFAIRGRRRPGTDTPGTGKDPAK